MKGCYDTEAHYAYNINLALNQTAPDLEHPYFTYSNEMILRQKKYILTTTREDCRYIIVRDLKLAYILGIDIKLISVPIPFINKSITF